MHFDFQFDTEGNGASIRQLIEGSTNFPKYKTTNQFDIIFCFKIVTDVIGSIPISPGSGSPLSVRTKPIISKKRAGKGKGKGQGNAAATYNNDEDTDGTEGTNSSRKRSHSKLSTELKVPIKSEKYWDPRGPEKPAYGLRSTSKKSRHGDEDEVEELDLAG